MPVELCRNCGWSPARSGCTAERCNTDPGAPWKYSAAGELIDRHENRVDTTEPYFRGVAVLIPELDMLARALAAAKTVGEARKLRPWADALVKRLDEARAIKPS